MSKTPKPAPEPKPWPEGEPTGAEKYWHSEDVEEHPEQKNLYWFPVRGGRLFTFFYPGQGQIEPTMTFVPEPPKRGRG